MGTRRLTICSIGHWLHCVSLRSSPARHWHPALISGKAVAIALPLAAGGITLLHDWDWTGTAQLALDEGLTVGTALVLKQVVREQRPDMSNFQSFPSETAAVAFAPAASSGIATAGSTASRPTSPPVTQDMRS